MDSTGEDGKKDTGTEEDNKELKTRRKRVFSMRYNQKMIFVKRLKPLTSEKLVGHHSTHLWQQQLAALPTS